MAFLKTVNSFTVKDAQASQSIIDPNTCGCIASNNLQNDAPTVANLNIQNDVFSGTNICYKTDLMPNGNCDSYLAGNNTHEDVFSGKTRKA